MINDIATRVLAAGFGAALISAAAFAGEPLLGVSGIEIPGEFLELRDADGDGIDDIIFVGHSGDELGYLPGQPGFGFGEAMVFDIQLLKDRLGFTIGVIDESGLPTALVLRGSELTGHRTEDGQTTQFIEEWVPGRRQSGSWLPREMLSGDLDGDGLTDLLIHRDGGFVIRWSDRQVFTRYQELATPDANGLLPIRDYDGDGRADVLILLVESRELIFYPGEPIGQLGTPIATGVVIPGSFSFSQYELDEISRCIGNLDGQGGLDLVYFTQEPGTDNDAVFVLNFATPDAQTVVTPLTGLERPTMPRLIGDLDVSGLDDLFYRYGTPPGTFLWGATGQIWFDPMDGTQRTAEAWLHSFARTLSDMSDGGLDALVRSIDTNGDGRNEIVTFSKDVSVLHSWTDSEQIAYGPAAGPASAVVAHTLAIDLNGDGLPELLNTGGLSILNPRDIAALPLTIPGYGSAFMSVPVTLTDDGVVRVAIGGIGALWIVSFGADGLPSSVETYPAPAGQRYFGLCVGDFDGDGRQDIAASSRDAVQIFRSLGDGTVEWYAEVVASWTIKPAAGDLDGDGLADLVVGDQTEGRVTVHANCGGGVFEAVQFWETTANFWLEIDDFDGDGLPDVVEGNYTLDQSGEVAAAIRFGLPEGGFGEPVVVRGPGTVMEIVTADLNGDGLKDFVFPDGPTFIFNDEPHDGTLLYVQTAPRVYEFAGRLPGWGAGGATVADFNADGAMDVATVNREARRTFVHWGTPSACPADLNQNGQADFGDLLVFLQRFNDQDPAADLAPAFGSWDFFDVLAYLAVYSAGCP